MQIRVYNPVMESILKYFPPQLRKLTGMSTPLDMLCEAAAAQDKIDKEDRKRKKEMEKQKNNTQDDIPCEKKLKKWISLNLATEQMHQRRWIDFYNACSHNPR